jgi:hypothetical protein
LQALLRLTLTNNFAYQTIRVVIDMTEQEKELIEKIRNAPHQSKPEEASLVVYDSEGRWLFEVYGGRAPLRFSKGPKGEHSGQ